VDGAGPYRPAVSQFGTGTEAVGTPAIASSPLDDVYLTIDALPTAQGGAVTLGVTVQPLVAWLWVGGAIVVLGAILAAVPGRRRRATDPASAPVPAVADALVRGPGPDADPALAEPPAADGAAEADVAAVTETETVTVTETEIVGAPTP